MKTSNFIFFHGYDEPLWDGFLKRGLIDKNAGVRFCQNILLGSGKKFNAFAAKGGRLFRLIHDNDMPWYIDRLQGGVYIDNYNYDMALIDSLGGKFYGFQMHEWVSNMRSDYSKLSELPASDWNEEAIKEEILKRYPSENLFLEAATAKEYERCFSAPETFEELLENAQRLFAMRNAYTGERLLPCDSVMMATNLEFKMGARRVMPEIGAQTPGANVQLSYARGMAKAYSGSFGAYYEPWGGEPFSACNYHFEGKNEWNIVKGSFVFDTCGPEGGSSRSLQKRLFLYAYLSGAKFISEEWGVYNTFLECEDFTLSDYGEVKRDFLSFVKKYPAGEFFAPMAVVLPEDMDVLENEVCSEWFGEMKSSDASKEKKRKCVKEGIAALMLDSESKYGNETGTLVNSCVPDAFDIIHADCEGVFGNYEYLVDLTGDSSFSEKHRNAVSPQQAKQLILQLMPCRVSGEVHWFVNKLDDGFYLTLFNNDGVDKSVAHGERFLPEATRTAIIELNSSSQLTRLEGCADITKGGNKYFVTMKAGEVFFAKVSRNVK
ncbi:MAG: hypothetical protein GX051_10270 [Clostridiales bacterium]|nr:hypothetical protein [Clostridiales bacterium]